MKAAVLYEPQVPLQVVEVSMGDMGPHDVRVRVGAAGLCHSDVGVQSGALPWPLPMILGHEGAGTVEEVGTLVTHVQPGDHVAMAGVMGCGRCRYCASGQPTLCTWGLPLMFESLAPEGPERAIDPGGRAIRQMTCLGTIAEEIIIPSAAAVPIAKDIPFEVAAVTGCAVISGASAVFRRAKVTPGSTVAVVGAGGVGLNIVQAARISGALRIIAIDPNPAKRELAGQFGATDVVDPADGDVIEQVQALTGGLGADYVLESVGTAEAVQQAWLMAGADGTIVVLGVPDPSVTVSLPVQAMALSHRTLTGAMYGGSRPHQDIPMYLEMYRRGQLKIDELITQRYTIEQVNEAIEDLHAGRNARGVFMLQ